jgi:hypothetical protein
MPEVPSWLSLGVVVIGAAVGATFMLSREKTIVEVSPDDNAMRPAIKDGTKFTVDTSWLLRPTRDVIVAYVVPGKPKEPTLGWAVAKGGDRLEVRARKLYVNGRISSKTKASMRMEEMSKFTCPRDCVFVLIDGSKRGLKDSSDLGPLPLWRILGSITP